jgi:hypothetical protein
MKLIKPTPNFDQHEAYVAAMWLMFLRAPGRKTTPGEPVREAEFTCTLASGHEVGYMYRALQSFEKSAGREPLRIPVAFSDTRGNEFTRVFILERGATANPAVMVTLGPLRLS